MSFAYIYWFTPAVTTKLQLSSIGLHYFLLSNIIFTP